MRALLVSYGDICILTRSTNCQANESLAHLSGDVRQNKMLVRKRDAETSSREAPS